MFVGFVLRFCLQFRHLSYGRMEDSYSNEHENLHVCRFGMRMFSGRDGPARRNRFALGDVMAICVIAYW